MVTICALPQKYRPENLDDQKNLRWSGYKPCSAGRRRAKAPDLPADYYGVAEALSGGVYDDAEDGEDRVHQPCQVDRELLLPFNCLFELFADVASTVHDT